MHVEGSVQNMQTAPNCPHTTKVDPAVSSGGALIESAVTINPVHRMLFDLTLGPAGGMNASF